MALIPVQHVNSRVIPVFVIFHALLYPASNGFNSFFDRDVGPIGGLANPPPVNASLLFASLLLDLLAIVWAWLITPEFALLAFIYGLGSKLYSWDKIRIKRLPIVGWVWTGLGQGAITFISMAAVLSGRGFFSLDAVTYGVSFLVTAFILGIYPLTQVYQHEEDALRGDMTISRLAGVRGTFILSAICLLIAMAGIFFWIFRTENIFLALIFIASQVPSLIYFVLWAVSVFKDEKRANAQARDDDEHRRVNLDEFVFSLFPDISINVRRRLCMGALIFARMQFGISIGFHYLFPQATLGLILVILIAEWLYVAPQ